MSEIDEVIVENVLTNNMKFSSIIQDIPCYNSLFFFIFMIILFFIFIILYYIKQKTKNNKTSPKILHLKKQNQFMQKRYNHSTINTVNDENDNQITVFFNNDVIYSGNSYFFKTWASMYYKYFYNEKSNFANEQLPKFFQELGLPLEKFEDEYQLDIALPNSYNYYGLVAYKNFPFLSKMDEFEGTVISTLLGGDNIFYSLRQLTRNYPQLVNVLLCYYFYHLNNFKSFNLLSILSNAEEIYNFLI